MSLMVVLYVVDIGFMFFMGGFILFKDDPRLLMGGSMLFLGGLMLCCSWFLVLFMVS